VSNATYYLAWLAAGLVLTAITSAAITRHLRRRVERRVKAVELLDALARYSGWVTAQRRIAFFQGEAQDSDLPLQELCVIQQRWFPELSQEMAQLLAVHAGLVDFLRVQQALRLKDAEAWLESDHDGRFMEFWRSHRHAVHATGEKVKLVTGLADEVGAGSTFPA
jgi:hypothetical protein